MTARLCALRVLTRCTEAGSWSSQTLDSELTKLEQSGGAETARNKALVTRLVLGVLQNRDLLDFYIDRFAARPGRLDPAVRNILRMGAYQIVFMNRIPAHAAVNESVALCRQAGIRSASGLVNAVLRRISEGNLPQPDSLAVKYSHPQWFVERLLAWKGPDFTEAFLQADNSVPELEYYSAFSGETYVQDAAAYQAVVMAAPEPGMRVLDACSAPGGKSFTAAVLMNNTGEIVACDIHEKKLRLVREGAERLGITNIRTRAADASEFIPEFSSAFDLVIADVPCSGFGVIRKKPEIRYKTEEEIAGLPVIQKRILLNVSRYVKPGGTLLYSTCTVFPEENEAVSQLLLDEGNFRLEKQRTFYPNEDHTDGFYAAVMKRKNGVV